jgi:conjugative relaxase-like TrwC/TraI family protein
MLTIKAMTGGETYAAHHLSNNDYYSVGETIEGKWMGRGAELLGLQGAVTMEQFEAIRQAADPATGEFLRQRKSADRLVEREKNGEIVVETKKARNLYDFTVSAPKGLSVQALEDPRLLEAHQAGVNAVAAEIERLAGASMRANGATGTRITSNMVIARYDHDTSRELDPQIHTHLVAGNLTYDGVEGKWKALAPYAIYQQAPYLTEVYRNAAARVVMRHGYQIEDLFERGKDNGFGIVGIEESTLEKFSRRSAQRDAAIAEFMQANDRQPSNNEITLLVRETRDPKLKEISTPEVKARQLARLTQKEAATLKGLHQTALERGSIREQTSAMESLAYASEHLFERLSVVKDHELYTEALRHGRGRIELSELRAALLAEVASGSMLTARGEVATKESLERERRMVAAINEGIDKHQALGRSREFVVSDRLRPEQKAALQTVLASRDFAVNIQGAAGTGKTKMLQDFDRAMTESRQSVVAVAPSTRAVQELQQVGFSGAVTIARLLADPQQGEQLAGQVLLVDEAGMVSSKDMAELIGLAQSKGARIVYSGDTAQLKSVSEGDALRVLERESKIKSVSLMQVQRQLNAEYKAAVEALRSHPAEGYERLEKMGAIREVNWRLVGKETSRAYREAAAVPNMKGEKRSVLVLARTHDQIKSITHAIREDRKAAGEIGQGETVIKHSALNLTEAQKKRSRNYQPGQVLAFHKAVKGIAKNEALEVVGADRDGVTARKENGHEVTLTSKQAKAYGVFERETLEVSAGDKLLLQTNWREKNFRATNGELVTVASVDRGAIKLEDGRQLPVAYRQFSSGYAVTVHAAQGATADAGVIVPDGMRRDDAYVATTRFREDLVIITSDAQALQESMGVSGDRQSAMELQRRAAAAAKTPGWALEPDDYRQYQAHRQEHRPAENVIEIQPAGREHIEREIAHHVDNEFSISL